MRPHARIVQAALFFLPSRSHPGPNEGHPVWHLTYTAAGRKQVLHISTGWAEEIRQRVETGHAMQDAVQDVLAANAQLLKLARQQRRR